MKKEFFTRPEKITETWNTWQCFMLGIPSMVFVVTGWKANGKENACLQSWTAFTPCGKDDFACIMSQVSKSGHMYQSLKETGVCVLNFPSLDVYDRCIKTIGNNDYDTDEITAAGLTAEPASKVNAPCIKECFLNIECELMWEHELYDEPNVWGNQDVTIALKVVNICMDSDRYDQGKLGRYGKTGYLFQIDDPTNPETGEQSKNINQATIELSSPIPWETK
ncbi:MAG: flavin reductase [Lachnospiraceae bacterium]|jgi:flavin reductase (DIM6/NTAB) family NADH-FMN oxidoreductase RutF|nr:flavin reductase [Lachnospiraceae bacterium]